MKFLNKYNKFFEMARPIKTPLIDTKNSTFYKWYSVNSDDLSYFFVSDLLQRLAGWGEYRKDAKDGAITTADRMNDIMSLVHKDVYTTSLPKISEFLSSLKVVKENGNVKTAIAGKTKLNSFFKESKMMWKIVKGTIPGELATISFNEADNRFMGFTFYITILMLKEPPEDLAIWDKNLRGDEDERKADLIKWLYDNSTYQLNTSGQNWINSPDETGFSKSYSKMITSDATPKGGSKLIIGNPNGFNSLSEALRQMWVWLIALNLNLTTGASKEDRAESRAIILKQLLVDSSKYEGKGETLGGITITPKGVLHATEGYATKIIDVATILQNIYQILGLKIEYGVQKTSDYMTRIDTTSDMVSYISISNNFQSVPNSFLDIVTKAVYNKSCNFDNAKWKYTTRKMVDNLNKPDKEVDIEGIVLELPTVVRGKAEIKTASSEKKVSEFKINIAPVTREQAISLILDKISKFFGQPKKLVVDGIEVDDIFGLGNLVKSFTDTLKTNPFDENLINNNQLYKLLYSYLTPVKDDSPIVLYEADGTKRANGIDFKNKIVKNIETTGISPLDSKFKALDILSTSSLSKAAKRGHRISDENPEDMLGYI